MRITESYKPDELPRLCELNDICFKGLERPPHEDFKNMLSVSEHWFARAENGEPPTGQLVLRPEGYDKIIGYVIVNRNCGAYLWQIAVDPLFRGRGAAKFLMGRAEQWCKSRGDDSIRLHCHSDNPSQKLYFDRGYRTYDLAHNYYGDGTIGLMMKKGL